MTEVQELIQQLHTRGWSLSAIARGLGVTYESIRRWQAGTRRPENITAVTIVLRQMFDQDPPKRPYGMASRKETLNS
jgi:hypothetical protein